MNIEITLTVNDMESLRSGVPVRKAIRGHVLTVLAERFVKPEESWEDRVLRKKAKLT